MHRREVSATEVARSRVVSPEVVCLLERPAEFSLFAVVMNVTFVKPLSFGGSVSSLHRHRRHFYFFFFYLALVK